MLEFANYNKGSLPLNVELISDSIPADIEIVRYIVCESGLFKAKEGRIYSEYLADIDNKKTAKKKPVKYYFVIFSSTTSAYLVSTTSVSPN